MSKCTRCGAYQHEKIVDGKNALVCREGHTVFEVVPLAPKPEAKPKEDEEKIIEENKAEIKKMLAQVRHPATLEPLEDLAKRKGFQIAYQETYTLLYGLHSDMPSALDRMFHLERETRKYLEARDDTPTKGEEQREDRK